MRLIIQIPCLDEASTLPVVLAALPRDVAGFDQVQWLLLDDGSTDDSVAVAQSHGVDHVVSNGRNLGLARTFATGLRACLERGADVVVNVDADNQYDAGRIPDLVRPILDGRADMVIGVRPIESIPHFSPLKKWLQRLGSRVVRLVGGTDVPDATSGFRALSAHAARRINIFDTYTYTLETIIQARQKGLRIACVPVGVNGDLRPSRLVRSIPHYVLRSALTMARIFVVYRPFRFFLAVGAVPFGLGLLLCLRYLWYYVQGQSGHVQSLILASMLIAIGFQTVMAGFLADLLSVNRRLTEELQEMQRGERCGQGAPTDGSGKDS